MDSDPEPTPERGPEHVQDQEAPRGGLEAPDRWSQQLADVRKEWGGEFEGNVRSGKRAVREFGLEAGVEELESALGSSDLPARLNPPF